MHYKNKNTINAIYKSYSFFHNSWDVPSNDKYLVPDHVDADSTPC